jgi:hypothetical protein
MTSYILTVFDVLPTALQRYGRFVNLGKSRSRHCYTPAAAGVWEAVCSLPASWGEVARSGLRAKTDRAVASPEGDRVMPSARLTVGTRAEVMDETR